MALWVQMMALLIPCVVVALLGYVRKSGVMMIAAGAWALFFAVCGLTVPLDQDFVMIGLPCIGAFGATVLALGLKALFKN